MSKLNATKISLATGIILSSFLIVTTAAAKQCTKEVITEFPNPVMNGMRIDRCVQGDRWAFANPKRCDGTRQRLIANAYCKSKGYRGSVFAKDNKRKPKSGRYDSKTTGNAGNHSIWTYVRGQSGRSGSWTQVLGGDAFSVISCTKKVAVRCPPPKPKRKVHTYNNPTYHGLAIDVCVQGRGWGFADSTRCNSQQRNSAAIAFCKTKQYERADRTSRKTHVGNHSIWTFPKGQNGRSGSWTQVLGNDAFKSITCSKRR